MQPVNDPDQSVIKDDTAFYALFEQVSDAIMITDYDANFLEVNSSFCKMIGYSREELLKMNVVQMFGPDEHSRRPIRFDLLKAGEHLINERTMMHRDGHVILVRANIKKLNETQIITIATDVSEQTLERQKARERLQKEKELSDKVINSLPGIFYVINDVGKYLRWNRNMEIQSGYTAEEISDLPTNALIVPDDREKVMAEISKVFKTGFGSVEARMLTKDGTMIPYYLTGTSIDYEGVPALLGTGIDISEQKMARHEARISEETRKLIMDSALDAIICADTDNRITVWTPQAEKIFGWKEKEMIGKTLSETIIPERYRKMHMDGFTRYRKTGKGQILNRIVEVDALNKKGQEFPIELSIIPIRKDSREFFCAFVRDITDRKQAENSLLAMNEQLRQLSSHLQTVREEERSHISREIHDELGQQLTSLKMLINRLKTGNHVDKDAIHAKAESMIDLVDETIKTVRRIATELRPGILDDLGLEAAIEWLIREFGKSTGIQCRYKITDVKETYSKQVNIAVFRIVQECLTNVSRHAQATLINAKMYEMDNMLVMEFRDNGVGISEENMNKNRSLGLLGMQERAKMVGGECSIRKLASRGTLVSLKIPV